MCGAMVTSVSGNLSGRTVFIPVILLLVSAGSVGAVTNVTGCGTLSTAGETYTLQNDISTSGTCFTIGADNIVLDGAGYSITGDGSGPDYGVSLYGRSGVTVKNLQISGFSFGISLSSSSNNNITDNNVSDNGEYGIFLDYSSSNTLTGNTASGNSNGIYLVSSSRNTLTGNNASNNIYGIWIYYSSSYNTLINNIANSNYYDGIALHSSSSYNTLINNTANSNYGDLLEVEYGISLDSSSNYNTLTGNNASNNDVGIHLLSSSNTITNNIAKENYNYDVYIYTDSDTQCNNLLENNTGSGDRSIKYFNSSVSLQDEVFSELILCNADNSNINNVTIEGSATKNNNGLLVMRTENSNFTNINSSNNYYGITLRSSSSNTLTSNIANSNSRYGIYIYKSSENTLTNNTANGNTFWGYRGGISLDSSSNNILTNNTASNNANGIHLDTSSNNNTLMDNTANSNNDDGILLSSSSGNTLTGNIANSNNGNGINLWSSRSNILSNNIANNNTKDGIDLSSSNNILTNNNASSNNGNGISLYSSNNTLTGNIAQENSWYDFYIGASSDADCNNDISGMTVSGGRSFLYYNLSVNLADMVVSELVLCNADNSNIDNVTIIGSDIYDNNGILLVRTDFATISNSNSSNNRDGIRLSSSTSNTITNNTASNNANGILLTSSSSNNTIANNTANLSNGNGILLSSFSSNNTIANNTANSNNGNGIYLYFSSDNVLTGNMMSANTRNFDVGGYSVSHFVQTIDTSNTVDGKPIYYLVGASDQVIDSSTGAGYVGIVNGINVTVKDVMLTKNGRGVLFANTSNSFILNVSASNNMYGIDLYYSSNNTLTSNIASLNNWDGIHLIHSSSNAITGNTANSNNYYGIYLYFSSDNILTNNNASSNNGNGINLYSSRSNLIYNNYFNNTNNFGFGATYNNAWNTTRTPGPSIVGGPYLGGNFWANPSGTGFSETCTDADGDGMCDSSYTLATRNVDNLPLTTLPVLYVTTIVTQRLDYYFNITWTIPPDPDLEEFNIYQRLNDNSSTDTLIDTVPANYTRPYIAGPGYDDGSLYQYMVTPVNTSGSEGSGAYAPKGGPAPPIPFAPLGTLLTLGSGLAAYLWYRRKVI